MELLVAQKRIIFTEASTKTVIWMPKHLKNIYNIIKKKYNKILIVKTC